MDAEGLSVLYDVDYVPRDGQSVPRLWYKEGRRAYFEESAIRPYLLTLPHDKLDSVLAGESSVLSVAPVTKEGKSFVKVTVKSTWDVVQLRDTLQSHGLQAFEYDVPFHTRVLIDRGETPYIGGDLVCASFDLEMFGGKGFPSVRWAESVPIDMVNIGYRVDGEVKTEVLEVGQTPNVRDERDLLVKAIVRLLEIDADCIFGYNSNRFDWPYFIERCKRLGISPMFGRDGTAVAMHRRFVEPVCAGRHLVDLMPVAQRDLAQVPDAPKVKSLKNVADYFGVLAIKDRVMIHGNDLAKMYRSQPAVVRQYAHDDAKGTLLLGEHFTRTLLPLARKAKARLTEMAHAKRGRQIEHAIIARAVELGRLVPAINRVASEGKYEGGFVFNVPRGIERNIRVLDVGCYSEDTEVLTYNGWKLIGEIVKDELVATLNVKTNDIEYQNVEETWKYKFNGNLVNISTRRGTDQLVTPDHRVLIHKRTSNHNVTEWKDSITILRAADIKDKWFSVPWFGNYSGRKIKNISIGNYSFDASSFLYWFGLFLGDGYLSRCSVSISQAELGANTVRGAMVNLGMQFKEDIYRRKNGCVEHRFSIHNKLFCDSLRELLCNRIKSRTKHVPREYLDLSQDLLKSLFDGLMYADGAKSGENFRVISQQLADDVQEIALKLGIFAHRSDEWCKHRNYYVYCVYLTRKKMRQNVVYTGRDSLKSVPYHGNVYCLTVPNGTLVTRRNGKPTVSGNSMYPTIMVRHNVGAESFCEAPACQAEHSVVPDLGHLFHKVPMGFVPQLVKEWRAEREPLKASLKQFKRGSSEWNAVEAEQNMLKLLANGLYGLHGWQESRFYHVPCAASITAYGRYYVQQTAAMAGEAGIEVVAGDTDSLFLREHAGIPALMKRAMDAFPVVFEDEGLYVRGFFTGKKKQYALLRADGSVKIRGLEVRRGDWCSLARDTQAAVLNKVLVDEDVPAAVQVARDAVRRVQVGDVSLEEMTIFKTLDLNTTSAHARAAKDFLDDDARDQLRDTKVGYVYVQVEDATRVMERIRFVDALPDVWAFDKGEYLSKQVIPAALRVLSLFQYQGRDITAETLLYKSQQAKLAEWFR